MTDQKNDNLKDFPKSEDLPKEALKKQIDELGQEQPQANIQVQEGSKPFSAPPAEGTTESKGKEPPLIAGKFKTQEDLIQAYQEIEKMAHQSSQRASEYRNAMSPYAEFDEEGNIINVKTPTPPQTPPQGQTQQQDIMAQLEQRYQLYEQQHGPVRANIMLQAEIANAIAQQQAAPIEELRAFNSIDEQKNRLRDSDPDFAKYEKDVDKHLKRMDSKSKQNSQAVQAVFHMILGENYKKLLKEKEQEASLKATEVENQKQKAQVEHQTKTPEEPPVNIDSLDSKGLASHFGLKKAER